MTPEDLRNLLAAVSRGEVLPGAATDRLLAALQDQPFETLEFARVDHHRALRQGFPEVILGLGKTPAQIAAIAERLATHGEDLLVTRATGEAFEAVRKVLPDAVYHEPARLIVRARTPRPEPCGRVLVVSAGTSDIPVAEEAALTAELMGSGVHRLYDVGVAGIHRLLEASHQLRAANVIVVVAGMEGALPSVVGGLVAAPIVAVPTSVGYGAHFGGMTPLLAMLNSCAVGVAVVNIDNGFGAGALAHRINRLAHRPPKEQPPGAGETS